jgi:cobaltochelatase CobN
MNKTLYVCNGCCCGHEEKNNPKVKNELFEKLVSDSKNVSIEKPYCLGPCHLANVVKVDVEGKEYWFQRVNTEEDVKAVSSFVKSGEMNDIAKGLLMF